METRYLFRGKRIDNGEWMIGNLIRTDEGVYIIQNYVPQYLIKDYEVDPSTICQCTGLKDKNGKLIWENDICKYQWNGKTKIDVIKYDPPMFSYSGAMRWNLDCDEVIGNKFDNPELLEV